MRHNGAVAEVDDAIYILLGECVVGGHQERRVALAHDGAEEVEHFAGRLGIEVGGGLVGDDQRRLADECPRNGDTLLLAAGEFVRPVVTPLGEANQVDGLGRGLLPRLGRCIDRRSANSTFS